MVQLYSETVREAGELGLTAIASWSRDPPDCQAIGPKGERLGIEVTEFVDQRLAGQNPMKTRPRFWEIADVIVRLTEIIEKKNLKCAGVKGFDRLMLLIHCDEMFLRGYAGDDVLEGLRDTTFKQPSRIDEVAFMMSYDARIRSYPIIKLRLAACADQDASHVTVSAF